MKNPISDWVSEETFIDRSKGLERIGFITKIVEKKMTQDANPVLMIRFETISKNDESSSKWAFGTNR
jgi:hypothetical protein